ncbi:hypothetical protein B7486_20045 [cyanobacterium TDX16]|nr:hypothetical protein B7486_20045 [cyanobacterium TDX16]
MACFDTSVLLDLMGRGGRVGMRRASAAIRRLCDEGKSLTTTCFNVSELMVGVHRANDADREREKMNTALEGFRVLTFDPACAELFGLIQGRLLKVGRPTGDMDALIASVAIRHQETLITSNVKHFADIPEIELEAYAV